MLCPLFDWQLCGLPTCLPIYSFVEEGSERTKRPEALSLGEKISTLFLGIRIPKPQNKEQPERTFETIQLQGDELLEAWLVEVPDSKGTVLLFHGYSSCKAGVLPYARAFNEKGYSTFLLDFRGSGGSTGLTTTVGYKEGKDVKIAFDYCKASMPNDKIILFGSSMGAVSIMKAIAEFGIQPDQIILECPFGTMLKTTKKRFEAMGLPSFPFAELILFYGGLQTGFNAFEHNPTDYAEHIDIPTLLLYGARDARVTREEIDEIFDKLKGKKKLGVFERSGHEIYLNHHEEEWKQIIDEFLLDG